MKMKRCHSLAEHTEKYAAQGLNEREQVAERIPFVAELHPP